MKKIRRNRGLIFISMGLEMVVLVLGSLYIGQIIDDNYSLNGWGVIGTLLLVLTGWFYHLIVLMKGFMKEDEQEGEPPSK